MDTDSDGQDGDPRGGSRVSRRPEGAALKGLEMLVKQIKCNWCNWFYTGMNKEAALTQYSLSGTGGLSTKDHN